MRIRLFFLISLLALPLATLAQENRANAPMIITSSGQPVAPAAVPASAVPTAPAASSGIINQLPAPANFPEWAITKAGQNTTGQPSSEPPAAPANPASAPVANTPANPPTAASPAIPASPAAPISKLWPRDTVPIFLPSCTGFHPELVAACTCVITRLMVAMGHDEFLAKSEAGTIEQDPRLITIRRECVGTPQRRQ